MNKIKGLLEKAGCNPELVGGICEALDSYKSDLREQFEADYKHRVEQAKKVCIDETESHKRELAKRVQIFCETKAAAIEAAEAAETERLRLAIIKLRDDTAVVIAGLSSLLPTTGAAAARRAAARAAQR